MKTKIWLISLIVICGAGAQAQIESFDKRDLHLSLGSEVQSYSLLFDNQVSGQAVTYSPNLGGLIVPRLTYKDLFAVSWAFQTPVSDADRALNGDTVYTDTRLAFDIGSFRISAFYLQYRGFFAEDSSTLDSTLLPGQTIIKPNLYSRSYGAEVTWVKNPERFSLRALTAQSERINGSGGSLLLGASYTNVRIDDPAGVIPNVVRPSFTSEALLSTADLSNIAVKVGYGYGVGRKWFIGGAIQGGPGVGTQKLVNTDGRWVSGTIGSMRIEALVSMGYNGDEFFSTLQSELKQDAFSLRGADTKITTQLSLVTLNVGVHLESLGF